MVLRKFKEFVLRNLVRLVRKQSCCLLKINNKEMLKAGACIRGIHMCKGKAGHNAKIEHIPPDKTMNENLGIHKSGSP